MLVVQVLVDLVQEELVVGGGSIGLGQVLAGEAVVVVVGDITVVNVRKDVLVPGVDIIYEPFESLVDILGFVVVVDILTVGGWVVVLGVEELDLWVDVLVEEDWVPEILTEGGHLPELLEVDGGDVTLEAGVLEVLTEQWDPQVLLEELGVVQLAEGEDTVVGIDIIVDTTDASLLVLPDLFLQGVDLLNISQDSLLLQGELVLLLDELLLQQDIIKDWPVVQQGFLLDETEGVQIQAAGSYGCDESDENLNGGKGQ